MRKDERSNKLEDYPRAELMFPSKYLRAVEFPENRDVTVTIETIEPAATLRTETGGTETKPVVHFVQTEKMWVLGPTNSSSIAKVWGADPRKWIGKRIALYRTMCQAFGKTVACVRVRETEPPAANGKRRPPPATELFNGDDVDPPIDSDYGPEAGLVGAD